MSVFACSRCLCLENTNNCNFWKRACAGAKARDHLCSECDPDIGKWHGRFQKKSAVGSFIGTDGFVYKTLHSFRSFNIKFAFKVTEEGFVAL